MLHAFRKPNKDIKCIAVLDNHAHQSYQGFKNEVELGVGEQHIHFGSHCIIEQTNAIQLDNHIAMTGLGFTDSLVGGSQSLDQVCFIRLGNLHHIVLCLSNFTSRSMFIHNFLNQHQFKCNVIVNLSFSLCQNLVIVDASLQ